MRHFCVDIRLLCGDIGIFYGEAVLLCEICRALLRSYRALLWWGGKGVTHMKIHA